MALWATALMVRLLVGHIEKKVIGLRNPPEHRERNSDNVFIAGEHLAFIAFHADVYLAHGSDPGLFHRFNGPDCEMQAGIGGSRIFAEPQHNTAFIGLNLVN